MTARRRAAGSIADPTYLWHEALPGVLGMHSAPCYHRVIGTTKVALLIETCCDPNEARGTLDDTGRIRRDELASGVGVDEKVRFARGWYVAFFFDGPVPAVPIRGPAWLRERRKAEIAAKVEENRRTGKTRKRRDDWDDPDYQPRARRVGASAPRAADLATLGLPTSELPTAAALKAAYRAKARSTHPDAGGTQAAFVKAKAAYDRLCLLVPGAA